MVYLLWDGFSVDGERLVADEIDILRHSIGKPGEYALPMKAREPCAKLTRRADHGKTSARALLKVNRN